MRILVLIHEFPPVGGGGGRVAQDLCRGFAADGHEVRVLTAALDGIPADEPLPNLEVIRVPSGRREPFRADLRAMGGFVFSGFFAARKMIRQWRPDLIHVHFAVPAGPPAWLLSKLYRIPYVLTAHLGDVPGGAPEKTGKWFRWIFPFTPPIWKGAARVAAVSEYTRSLARAHYPVEISVIPNGVDVKSLRPLALRAHTPPRIVFAGRFMVQKNPVQLVRVLGQLRDLPWQCVMLGDGPLRTEVEAEIARQGLVGRIDLRGWVAPQAVLAEFARSDILFMPSRSEGLPVVGVQALASGLAVIAGDVGGFRDVVRPGVNGALYKPDDLDGMKNGLAALLTDPESLLNSRRQSLQLAEDFDLRRIIAAYENLFSEVVQQSQ
ncbi:MAG TPA: glycosyltransferase family 1 protein [Anaerolineales bacterium]|nr:glycosyltransferase family 1 protein [Anaerolineales bacterium]